MQHKGLVPNLIARLFLTAATFPSRGQAGSEAAFCSLLVVKNLPQPLVSGTSACFSHLQCKMCATIRDPVPKSFCTHLEGLHA